MRSSPRRNEALRTHELIKVKVGTESPIDRKEAGPELADEDRRDARAGPRAHAPPLQAPPQQAEDRAAARIGSAAGIVEEASDRENGVRVALKRPAARSVRGDALSGRKLGYARS